VATENLIPIALGSVEKLPNRVDATPSSRFCWNKKAAGAPLLLCSAELFNSAIALGALIAPCHFEQSREISYCLPGIQLKNGRARIKLNWLSDRIRTGSNIGIQIFGK